jgi:uncharacterized protein (DUF952 family)
MIYKVWRDDEWADFQRAGVTRGAPIDLADGYIHFSTAAQLRETVAKHFTDEDGLWIAALAEGVLADALRWEPSRGGALFPHLYRPLHLSEVQWCVPLPRTEDGHVFPEHLA